MFYFTCNHGVKHSDVTLNKVRLTGVGLRGSSLGLTLGPGLSAVKCFFKVF